MASKPKRRRSKRQSQSQIVRHTASQISDHRLNSINIRKLKSIEKVMLEFKPYGMTAIMGMNASGKTTVLHALACVYDSDSADHSAYRFPQFFRPNTDALWAGSEFEVSIAYKDKGAEKSEIKRFEKREDSWVPKQAKKLKRYVRFLGIGESVPDLETIKTKQKVHYLRTPNESEVAAKIISDASDIMNTRYLVYHHVDFKGRKRKSIGVTTNNATYTGLSMSSGEFRLFRILEMVHSAPKYGLILIDELDLFLHQHAIEKLINVLNSICESKKLQLIFTTHSPFVAVRKDIEVFTIDRGPQGVFVWRGCPYEAIRKVTGDSSKPFQVYVEDDVAKAVVSQVAVELGIDEVVSFVLYGASSNAVTAAAQLCVSDCYEHKLIVLDGDRDDMKLERFKERLDSVYTGTEGHRKERIMKALDCVTSLKPSEDDGVKSPEQVLKGLIHSVQQDVVSQHEKRFYEAFLETQYTIDPHGYVDNVVDSSISSRDVVIYNLVLIAARSPGWHEYTRDLRAKLERLCNEHRGIKVDWQAPQL